MEFLSNNLHRALRQRVEEGLAVLLGKHAIVQHHDDAGVDILPQKEYFCRMETVTFKMERKHITLLRSGPNRLAVRGRRWCAI